MINTIIDIISKEVKIMPYALDQKVLFRLSNKYVLPVSRNIGILLKLCVNKINFDQFDGQERRLFQGT